MPPAAKAIPCCGYNPRRPSLNPFLADTSWCAIAQDQEDAADSDQRESGDEDEDAMDEEREKQAEDEDRGGGKKMEEEEEEEDDDDDDDELPPASSASASTGSSRKQRSGKAPAAKAQGGLPDLPPEPGPGLAERLLL